MSLFVLKAPAFLAPVSDVLILSLYFFTTLSELNGQREPRNSSIDIRSWRSEPLALVELFRLWMVGWGWSAGEECIDSSDYWGVIRGRK
ncbi:uncharacterized protein P174DRAFT_440756 [Aspergillus novofumigatus IBT 16806]|uniref:Uncharacterized protein n=1 Tax=Aspergillus novofumigatus (strain IBT 16806) TaxID=1392255 RepID=A0A2I1CEZ8_ASPN1|nr:uncharacterized protein P174DRAFT_440756 [Aspergillus novofumigatus IBT 16806]PKX96168.1 hypothetical protein P174DRAFT_440756 [Aspergillus novofumigatus IBT 16806]